MTDLTDDVRQKLIERLRQIIEDHHASAGGDAAEVACSCGAQTVSDHPGHVAEQIVDGLALKPTDIDEVKKRIRYASAWLDWELTLLEGAEY